MDLDDIERAFAGDQEAQRVLGARVLPIIRVAVTRRLFPFARACARDPASERDDLVNGVWVRLLEHDWAALRNFDPARGSFDAYITTIADRHVLSVFRVKSRDPYAQVPTEDDELEQRSPAELDVEGRIWARAELEDLYAFLGDHLDERGMLLFHMLEVDGLEVAEVCARANISMDALYQRRTRLRKLMRRWRSERQIHSNSDVSSDPSKANTP